MSTPNPTHIIAEGMREVATEGQKGTPGTREDGQLWGAFPNTMTLTDLAAHVVSKLTDAGYSIIPSDGIVRGEKPSARWRQTPFWGAFPNTMTLKDLAAHVVSKLTDAGYSIVPTEHRAEARQWDGTRASIEALCKWVNAEDDPMDDATLTYTYFESDDVCRVDFAGEDGFMPVMAGHWIIRTVTGEFLLARSLAAAAEGEKP